MKNALLSILFLLMCGATIAQVTPRYDKIRINDTLTLSGASLAEIVRIVSATSKHNESPTAKAVYDYIQTFVTVNGDLTGTLPNPTVDGLQGRSVLSTAPTTGDVLKWNGSAWAPGTDTGTTYTGGTGISVAGTVINNDGVLDIDGEIGSVTGVIRNTSPVGDVGGDVSGTIDEMTVIGIQGQPLTGDTPASGEVLKWNGTAWDPAADGGGGGGGIPVNEIAYGDGTSITSDTNLMRQGKTLKITIPNTTLTEPATYIDFQSNLNTTNTALLSFIDMRAFAKRISNTSPHGQFPSWGETVSWGQPVLGTDTVGNLIKLRGFNLFGQPGYNPKFPNVHESIEQRYRFPGSSKWSWEWHIEYVDTLGRTIRPYTMNYNYDGSAGSIAFASSERKFFKMPESIGPDLNEVWEKADFLTGIENLYYPLDMRIEDRTNHSIIKKLSSNSAGYRNVLDWVGNNQISLGDSSGIKLINRIEMTALSAFPEIYSASGSLTIDSATLTINSKDVSNFRYLTAKNTGSANTLTECFDGTEYYVERNLGVRRPWAFYTDAPNWSMILAQNGDFGVGTGSQFANLGSKFYVADNTQFNRALVRLKNTSGENSIYRNTGDAQTSLGSGVGTDGDISLSNTGLYFRTSGIWQKLLFEGGYGSGSLGQVATWGSSNLLTGVNQLFYTGGKLGVGTSTPNSTLYVRGGDASIFKAGTPSLFLGDLNFESPGAYNLAPGLSAIFNASTSVTSDLGFYSYSGSRNLGAILSYQGNFGIGNATPSEKLDVTGNIRFSGALMPNNNAGSSGQVLTSSGAGSVPTWQNALNGIYSGSGSTPSGGSTVTVTDANKLIFTSTESSGNQVRFNMTQGSGIQYNNNSGTQLNRTYSTGSAFVNESTTRQQTIQGATSVNLLATDGIKSGLFTVNENNYVTLPSYGTFPTVTGGNKTGWNSTNNRISYAVSGVEHSVADLQRDFVGTALSIRTADFTMGTTNVLSEIIDCNAGAVVVTLGDDLREGFDYVVKCRRNGTNTVTFNAGGSNVFEIDTVSTLAPTTLVVGAGGSGIEAPHKVYTIRRSGTNIFIQ